MKKLFVIYICIFFLLSLIAFAQNEANATAPPAGNISNATPPSSDNATQAAPSAAPPTTPAVRPPRNASQQNIPDCGNGKADTGENCFSCARDVKCQSGQQCNMNTRQCETITNFTTYIILGIGIFVLLGLFFVAKRLMKTREKQSFSGHQKSGGFLSEKEEPLPKQQPAAVQAQKPVVQQPPFGQQQTPEPLSQQQPSSQPSPVANAQIQMPPSTPETSAEQKQTDKEQGFQEMSQTIDEHPGETMPQKFIRQMREKGWNDERIRMKMKESGWNETQIALEFLKAPKFIKKS